MSLAILAAVSAQGQDQEQADEKDLYALSLEDLMNIPINSASKRDETLFDAPLASYTITKAAIDRAGSTSIMEALRLAPGVIVREQANGVYDIHIRGFDNMLRTSELYAKSNLATLVMIDNRPVFNHNLGGTFWEALPIDLNDVDRIEIVRGPSAPLFGPNAVTGVINIITKRAVNGTYANGSVQYGTPNTLIANGSFGKKVSEKFNFGLSINHQTREKFDDMYYVAAQTPDLQNGFYSLDQIFGSDKNKYYPNATTSLNKTGGNVYLGYTPAKDISFDLSAGLQNAESQKISVGGLFTGINFTTGTTQTQYVNLNGQIHHFAIRSSYLNGKDDLSYGQPPNKYDYKIADVQGEYAIKLSDKATITPGASYQSISYDDGAHVDKGVTFLNGDTKTINTLAGFVRSDFTPVKNLRVIAALRMDKFSKPDKTYLAYEFATTYKVGEKNLIRGAITRSNSGSFIANNDLNFIFPLGPGVNLERKGNDGLRLFTINMIEFGFRSKLSKSVQLDIDVFRQHAENFTALIIRSPLVQEFDNIPTTADQTGATLSLNIVPNEKWQIKPFLTVQSTETHDLPSAFLDPAAGVTYSSSTHTNTPSWYGGYYINFQPSSKFTINTNGYFFAAHRQYDASDKSEKEPVGDIKGKLLVNLKVAYHITPKFSIFLNGRNISNNNSREFFGGDQIQGLYMGGASFKL